MNTKSLLALSLILLLSQTAMAMNEGASTIKIGETFAYSTVPDQAESWKNGWTLALIEINESGGVLGKKLEVISRDDKSSPPETIKILEEYKNREGIKIFFGTLLSHTSLAASDFAKRNSMLIFKGAGGSPKLVGPNGHDLYFQLGPSADSWAGYYAETVAPLRKKRWAVIAADYELGRSVVAGFQDEMKKRDPSVEFVETQWFPINKIDAGAIAQVVSYAKPDAIFTLVWGNDYTRLLREGNKRGLFKDRLVAAPFSGTDVYIRPLGKEAPVAWYSVQGFPANLLTDKAGVSFVSNYKSTYNDEPFIQAFLGYSSLKIVAEAINIAGTDEPIEVAKALHSNSFTIPSGKVSFRADGLSTLGEWVGKTGFVNDVPTIADSHYVDFQRFLPSAESNVKSREGQK